MAISYFTGKGSKEPLLKENNSLRINVDSNLRRWFSRNLGLWRSRRQYFFEEDEVVNLDMFIKVDRIPQSNPEYESYRFKWWCENDYEFFSVNPSYRSEGVIDATLQGHQLFRKQSYLSESPGTSNIRQVDEHELIFESHHENWDILEHTRLIDEDRYRSRVIYRWDKRHLKVVENHHEIRL